MSLTNSIGGCISFLHELYGRYHNQRLSKYKKDMPKNLFLLLKVILILLNSEIAWVIYIIFETLKSLGAKKEYIYETVNKRNRRKICKDTALFS